MWLPLAGFLVNVGLAIIAVIAVCIYSRQLKVMQGQLDQIRIDSTRASDELHRSHRPWVDFAEPPRVVRPLEFADQGASLEFSYLLRNGGTSTATGAAVFNVGLRIRTYDDPSEWIKLLDIDPAWNCDLNLVSALGQKSLGMVILPGTTKQIGQATVTVPKSEFRLRNSMASAFLIGCIIYRDEFNIPHATGFTQVYIDDNGKDHFAPKGKIPGRFKEFGFAKVLEVGSNGRQSR